jgi:mannose-6-phosphate isomerase-like protein (cupin superfamily)
MRTRPRSRPQSITSGKVQVRHQRCNRPGVSDPLPLRAPDEKNGAAEFSQNRQLDGNHHAAYVTGNATGNDTGMLYLVASTQRGPTMLKGVTRQEAVPYQLPGRDWYLCIGPENSATANLTVGRAVFPGGSAPAGHVHDAQEEVIYVVAGRGRLVTPDGNIELQPGTTVYIPIGLHHATVSSGPEPLELVCAFSPPVIPGSYEVPSNGNM